MDANSLTECTLCGTELDVENGDTKGYIGTTPVGFCVTCASGLIAFANVVAPPDRRAAPVDERKEFDQWYGPVSAGTGSVAMRNSAWDGWKARAALSDPDALDCRNCHGMGRIQPSIDPQHDEVCPACRGKGEIE